VDLTSSLVVREYLEVVFIQTGVIAMGLDGYYTSLGFGVVIVLSLLGHRRYSGRLTK
jgi:hypothetical protein